MTKRCKNCGWPNDDSCIKCQKCNAPLDGSSTVSSSSRDTSYEPKGGYQPNLSPGGENLRKTVSENQFFGSGLSNNNNSMDYSQKDNNMGYECPNCHYQLREGVEICPNCGTSIKEVSSIEKGKKCLCCGEMNPKAAVYCNHCGKVLDVEQAQMYSKNHSGDNHGRTGTVNPWMQPPKGAFCTLKPIAWEGENVDYKAFSFSGSTISLNRANTDPNNQSITSNIQAELTFEDGEWFIIDKSAMHTTYVMASRKMKLEKGDTIILGNRLFEFN